MQDIVAYLLLIVAAGWLVWTFLIPGKLKPAFKKNDKNKDAETGCNCKH
ncbi:hypothetical protein [Halalkalibaculum roseum]|nr:hypothetical protein [Halalkalibaculum roseum]